MKTAISIDDELLKEADTTAKSMGLSRSRLFSVALGAFLQHQKQDQMLLRLNEIYSAELEPAEAQTLKGAKRRFRQTIKESW